MVHFAHRMAGNDICQWFEIPRPVPFFSPRRLARRSNTYQQSQFPPFPMAIHILKSDLPQPIQLRVQIHELVRRIFFVRQYIQLLQKLIVQPQRRRCNVLKIAKHTTWNQSSRKFRSTAPVSVHGPNDESQSKRQPRKTSPNPEAAPIGRERLR